jgi:hypothetical protein
MFLLTNVLSTGNRSQVSPGESVRTNVGQMGDNARRNRVHITHHTHDLDPLGGIHLAS